MKTQRKESDVENLLNLMSSLPKGNTETTSEEPKKKSDGWKHKSISKVSTKGRVNRTRGK